MDALYFVYIGIAEFITVYISTAGFVYVGERVGRETRQQFLEAILRQNMGFFDHLGTGEVINQITHNSFLVQTAISEKIATILMSMGTFLAAIIISLTFSWKLALISLSSVVLMFLLMGTVTRISTKFSTKSREAFDLGAGLAEDVIRSIKIITAYGAQDKLGAQFDAHLAEAEIWGIKTKVLLGVSIGGVTGILFLNLGLSFWEGSRLLVRSEISVRDITAVTLSIVIGSFSMVYVAPNIQHIAAGISAGARIFAIIERASPIDPSRKDGKILENFEGRVSFNDVKHIYPSRRETIALKGASVHVPAGKTIAFVGPSGSGKTTFINLLQRFYEPQSGTITLDDHDITTLNLRWLRRQIGQVSQDPTLFSTTVYQNIAFGLTGSEYEDLPVEKKRELVIDAAKMANAHNFIISLPKGYDAWVGEDGSQLSGGQKQRIAIARAIVRNPKILLLDEATSALDSTTEALIQEAIHKVTQGRTTLVVAHRLSTIQKADRIVVINQGNVVEEGTHQELLGLRGFYFSMYQAQQVQQAASGPCPGSPNSQPEQLTPTIDKDLSEKSSFTRSISSESNIDRPLSLEDVNQDVPQERSFWALIMMMFRFNRPDVRWMALGLVFSIISGGGSPTHVVFLVKNITTLSKPPSEYNLMRSDVNFWSAMYLMLGLVLLLCYSIHGYALGICSERLLRRARLATFEAIARQDMKFFDRVENSTGSLISFLSVQTSKLVAMSGSTLGTILAVITTLIAALAISISFGYKLGLVCASMTPILLACGFLRFHLLALLEKSTRESQELSAAFACEAVSAISTVATLTRETEICTEYRHQQHEQTRKIARSTFLITILYALSQSLFFFVAGLSFWYGGKLVAAREYSLLQLLICFLEVMFSTQYASALFSYAPDIAQAKVAATNLTLLFEQPSEMGNNPSSGQQLALPNPDPNIIIQGAIEFRDVSFTYPFSGSKTVLRNLNMVIKPGQHIALVGASGCGKSTILALLERFYTPTAGSILLDGMPISSLNIGQYRSFFSIVNQNPTILFMSLRDNITLGMEGVVGDEKIIAACQQARIYEFIQSLPYVPSFYF
jgi:ATP-binding cassette subfamily B (MDR/TAP) protein 1